MADPLSILASIIAIVQISGKVISICYDYRSGVKKAPRDLARITDEVISLRDVLERLIRIIDEDNANNGIRLSTVEMLNKPGGPLPRITAQLEELEVKLKPANGWRAVGKALTWPLREGDANKTLDVIRRIKETLSLALLTDQTYVRILSRVSTTLCV